MKIKFKILAITFFVLMISSSSLPSVLNPPEGDCDSLQVLKLYSLFSEYHKNKDYKSALPYGWQVLECDKAKFGKWIYSKMEDCLWMIHDSTDASAEEKKSIEDTMITFYDLAIQYNPVNAAYFQVRKAFVMETWLNLPPNEVIPAYEKAFEMNPDLSTYYLDRLGLLYIDNESDENDYNLKAVKLYSDWSIKEPDNTIPIERLKGIVSDKGLLDVYKKAWELDHESLEKAWTYASACIREQEYQRAIEPLEFLTQKAPDTINYWDQLATAYQKTHQLSKAEDAYIKLTKIDPDNRNHYLNLGIVNKDKGNLSKARQYYQKASEVGNGWGLPIYYEGLLYESSARNCTFDFKAKLVYLLAVQTYRRAASMKEPAPNAQERISALQSSIPTQEDWFFHGYKSGDTVPITGDCFTWIGKSVTVP